MHTRFVRRKQRENMWRSAWCATEASQTQLQTQFSLYTATYRIAFLHTSASTFFSAPDLRLPTSEMNCSVFQSNGPDAAESLCIRLSFFESCFPCGKKTSLVLSRRQDLWSGISHHNCFGVMVVYYENELRTWLCIWFVVLKDNLIPTGNRYVYGIMDRTGMFNKNMFANGRLQNTIRTYVVLSVISARSPTHARTHAYAHSNAHTHARTRARIFH